MSFSLPASHCAASLLGRNAIVIDLTHVLRAHSALRETHLTLLYRHRGHYDAADLARVQASIDDWLFACDLHAVPFQLRPWGRCSDLVDGALHDLCQHVRAAHNGSLHRIEDCRPPHVALRC